MNYDDALRIAAQMSHHVPDVSVDDLTLDIVNQKWHHVAATIAKAVQPGFMAGQRRADPEQQIPERSRAMTVCSTCQDTHRMELGDKEVMCTRCPLPCKDCKGWGPYCVVTPCTCICHDKPHQDDRRMSDVIDAVCSMNQDQLKQVRAAVAVRLGRLERQER